MKKIVVAVAVMLGVLVAAGCESAAPVADPVNPKTEGSAGSSNPVLANIGSSTVLVEFEKAGCKLCHEMRPYIDDIAKTTGIRLIREMPDGQMVDAFIIRKFPTVIVYKNGKEFQRWEGANDPNEIEKVVKRVVRGSKAKQ